MRRTTLLTISATLALATTVAFITLPGSAAVACSPQGDFTMVVPADGEVVGPSTSVGFEVSSKDESFAQNTSLTLTQVGGGTIELSEAAIVTKGSGTVFVTAIPKAPLAPGQYTFTVPSPPDANGDASLSSTFTVSAAAEDGPPSELAPDLQWHQVAFEKEGTTNNSCGNNDGMFVNWVEVTAPPGMEGRAQWYEVVVFMAGNKTKKDVLVFKASQGQPTATAVFWTPEEVTCVGATGFNAHKVETPEANLCSQTRAGTHPGGDVGLSLELGSPDITWTAGGQGPDDNDEAGAACASGAGSTGFEWLLWMALLFVVRWVSLPHGGANGLNRTPQA